MKTQAGGIEEPRRRRRLWKRVIIWVTGVLAAILILVVLALTILTQCLTSDRLTKYFNTYASEYVNADVSAKRIEFTFWSTFPHLWLEIDSLQVDSRALDSLPSAVRDRLPDEASSLCRIAKISGSFNTLKAIHNSWHFKDLKASGVNINLVQATDSVANWDIIKKHKEEKFQVPYFTVAKVDVEDVRSIRYTGVNSAVTGTGKIEDMRIARSDTSLNDYTVSIRGLLSADVERFPVLQDKEFNIDGNAALRFDPFGATFDDFRLQLAGIGNINLGMEMGEHSKINLLNCRLNTFDLMAIWEFVSEKYFPTFRNLVTNLNIESEISLTEPYPLDSQGNPDIDISINRLQVGGRQFDMNASAEISDLLGNPRVSSVMRGDVDLSFLQKYIPSLTGWNLKGRADADLDVSFNLAYSPQPDVSDIRVAGLLRAKELSCDNPSDSIFVEGRDAHIRISSRGDNLSATDLGNANMDFAMTMGGANLRMPTFNAAIAGLDVEGNMKSPAKGSTDKSGYPTWVHLRANTAQMEFPGDTSNLKISNFKLLASWDTIKKRNANQVLTLTTAGDSLRLLTPRSTFRLNSFRIALNSSRPERAHAQVNALDYRHPSRWLDSIPHREPYLFVDAPQGLITLMKQYDVAMRLRATDGLFLNKGYPAQNYLTGVDLEADFDSITLHKVAIKSQDTKMSLSGRVRNLRQWLLHDKGTPLALDLNLAVDTLNFNQIAHTYEGGLKNRGKSTAQQKEARVVPDDTLSMLVPRNLLLDMRASAKATEYTNLNLYDLSTRLRLHDGDLELDSLKISASFGKGCISAKYFTDDIEKIHASAAMKLQDINVVKFFEKYQALLEMMPQMKNLSGIVNLDGEISGHIFPNMDIDMNSVQGRVEATGTDLRVKQNDFIRHITKMMLIPYGGELKIKNICARADIHDNLLEVHPFDVEFFKYKIQMMGINDFQGDLNYHISVLKMPIPLARFGINIRGDYHKPKFSFGSHYDVRNTQDRMNIYDTERMNLVSELNYFLDKFIHNASSSVR